MCYTNSQSYSLYQLALLDFLEIVNELKMAETSQILERKTYLYAILLYNKALRS